MNFCIFRLHFNFTTEPSVVKTYPCVKVFTDKKNIDNMVITKRRVGYEGSMKTFNGQERMFNATYRWDMTKSKSIDNKLLLLTILSFVVVHVFI